MTHPTEPVPSTESQTIESFLHDLASKKPTPGGGAVASVTAALSAAVAQMVLNYSIGKKKLAEHRELHDDSLMKLKGVVGRALELAEEDARAYGRLNALWKLDTDDPKRLADWDDAVQAAIDAPRGVLDAAVETLRLLNDLCGKTNRMLDSDLAIAAILAEAAARSAAWNIRINLPQVEDSSQRATHQSAMDAALEEACRLAKGIEQHCAGS